MTCAYLQPLVLVSAGRPASSCGRPRQRAVRCETLSCCVSTAQSGVPIDCRLSTLTCVQWTRGLPNDCLQGRWFGNGVQEAGHLDRVCDRVHASQTVCCTLPIQPTAAPKDHEGESCCSTRNDNRCYYPDDTALPSKEANLGCTHHPSMLGDAETLLLRASTALLYTEVTNRDLHCAATHSGANPVCHPIA